MIQWYTRSVDACVYAAEYRYRMMMIAAVIIIVEVPV